MGEGTEVSDHQFRTYVVGADGSTISRKVTSGTWFVETPIGRRTVTVEEAVVLAQRLVTNGGKVIVGVKAGNTFYMKLEQALASSL